MYCNTKYDEKLTAALMLYQKQWMNSLPKDEELENITFSKKFRNKMQTLLYCEYEDSNKGHVIYFTSTFRRITSLVLASVMFVSLALFSVTALRDSFLGFFKNTNDGISTTINLSENPAYDPKAVFTETYFYVPADFLRTEYNCSTDYFRKEYVNGAGNYIHIYQGAVYGGGVLTLDTEDSKIEDIELFGSHAFYYEKRGNRLFWQQGSSYYIMVSDLPKEEILEIARSAYN